MERAFFDARLKGWSAEPIVEMLIPSTLDDSLAPPGRHVASLFCQHVAPELPDGRSWDEARETVADLMIETVEAYAPGFKASIIARQILSPLDLERDFGLVGGDIFHGQLEPRPALFGEAGARPRRLPLAHSRPLYVRRLDPPRRRRHRRPRLERGARDDPRLPGAAVEQGSRVGTGRRGTVNRALFFDSNRCGSAAAVVRYAVNGQLYRPSGEYSSIGGLSLRNFL